MATKKRVIIGDLRLDAKCRTPNGFLECDAMIARTGIQTYHRGDGTIRREYRPPEEVFKADALARAAKVPITFTPDTPNWHPQEPVTAANARQYTVGITGDQVKADGKWVKTTALIFDARAIEKAESGEFAQLSCGYECDLDMTPGTTPDGEKYDGVQTNIRINHVAMVRAARAGPEARLRLDADDNEINPVADDAADHPKEDAVKIKIAGVEVEVPDMAAQLIEKERADAKAEADKAARAHADALTEKEKAIGTLRAEAEKEKARADAAAAEKTKAEQARKDAEDPKRVQALIAARVDLEGKARVVLGNDVQLAEKTDAEIKRAVAEKVYADLKLDGKSEMYIEALFDRAVEEKGKVHAIDKVRGATQPGAAGSKKDGEGHNDADELDANAAQAAMHARNKSLSAPAAKK